MPIEDVLSSKGRVKILRILAEISELNISEIARRAGLNYATTHRHLEVLESCGLIGHKRFGRIQIFYFNASDPRAEAIRKIIDQWDE